MRLIVTVILALVVAAAEGDRRTRIRSHEKIQCLPTLGDVEVATLVAGIPLKTTFNGTSVNLLELYNQWCEQTHGSFTAVTARLLLGYGNDVFVIPYHLGEVVDDPAWGGRIFKPRPRGPIQFIGWYQANRDLELVTNVTMVELGEADPAELTFSDDIVFVGDRLYHPSSGVFVDPRHPLYNFDAFHKRGNHFDLATQESVRHEAANTTLIAVIDGHRITRKPCYRLTFPELLLDCRGDGCDGVQVVGEDYCFFLDDCQIAHGPESIFREILVIPKGKFFAAPGRRLPTQLPGETYVDREFDNAPILVHRHWSTKKKVLAVVAIGLSLLAVVLSVVILRLL
ncbi:hypothetical protein L596_016937 [Steinernema carpocapsae]|uniref:Uncharacterized protein n=1 Tax=Steinernema carpocapsae TaxID=34508 RepID=A0A4U5N0X9_STECR|nr:hypothetical protein L596_016937 [Steinernema carpocapsae]